MITTSVVEFKSEKWESVKVTLSKFSEVEIYGINEATNQALIIFDTHEQKGVEEICKKLNEHEGVITIAHHSFYFEDETDMPLVEELFKKKG